MKYFIGIVVLIGIVLGAWFYMKEAPQAEEVALPESDTECYTFPGYTLITRARDAAVGEDILIKHTDEDIPCVYEKSSGDIELASAEAVYALTIIGDTLLLDEGTAPPPRGLSVYDLTKGEIVYTDRYNTPIEEGSGTFTYWQPIDTKPTAENCPDLAMLEQNGLGAGIERRVTLTLETLEVVDLKEVRCSPRQ